MDLKRLQALSGRHPKQIQLDNLQTEQAELNKAYSEAIAATKRNEPLNEGLFSALRVALSTASNMGKSVAGAAADKVKAMSAQVKEFYKDAKAQAELTQLVKEMAGIVKDFQDIEKAAPTILSKDPEVKKTMELFSQLLKNSIVTLQARQASVKGVTEATDIQTMIDSQLNEDDIVESSSSYEDSAEFTEDLSTISGAARKVGDIVLKSRFHLWMKTTDENYDTNTVAKARDVLTTYKAFKKAVDALNDELEKAD